MGERTPLGRITVLAPGGVGGLLAGVMARQGHPVTIVATEPTAEHIASAGLRVDSGLLGDFRIGVEAVPAATEHADVLIVAAKATALPAALARVSPRLAVDALIVPLLNGYEHMDLLRAHYPGAHVLASSIRVESTRVAPGHIAHTSPFAALDIAYSGAPADRVETLAEALRAAGLDVRLHHDEAGVLWRKFHFLLPTALVCTHHRSDIGTARAERRADLLGVAHEVEAVAAARGLALDTARVTAMFDAAPPATKPSMLRDREAGRPMEVDALGGALLRAAAEAGVPVPVTERIVADLRAVDAAG
ncbi:ketopantoate reductase family protein [Streptomonospora nanhaiensis]|uniref:2-dehydropantoate 2-reductase n=1 Tax=Streptomonospora nanhaiensis TaxID=1323731 RepID=A0A853BG70_9ACTN|nr:2-dehydropantoate 2-reductase [Streptomonospora nanhaiensis]MBV2364393.1 2-dehydropantoate 2-reductase [Streptomonospora nanhaiensis]NYI94020.1 2-dehydropantoate 2-reductase [Streptomonospora nanhaiensis]